MIAMYTFRAMAEEKPTWMLSYSWDGEQKINPSDAMKNLFVSQVMSGTNSWDAARHVMSGSNDYDTRTEVYKWIKENEQLIYNRREPMSPVGVYFSPNTRDYFSDSWERSYFGTMELLMQKGIEFEIVTPRTLDKFKSGLLIFPDVRSLGNEELAQIETILKGGKKHLIFTAHTGEYDSMRKKVTKDRIKSLVQEHNDNAMYIADDRGSELEEIVGKNYLPSVEIKGGRGCVSQITSVKGRTTVYIANFTGLKSKENAVPIPVRDVNITFNNVSNRGAVVNFIPFLGKSVQLKGEWNKNDLTVSLPDFLRGAIVTLSE
jgi:hypothetical protein